MVQIKDNDVKFIKLVELANTWQGEGPDTGRQMLIARFKYCDRHCAFCDTWIKMKTSAEGSYSIDDINTALMKTKGLMITGGEPTFHSSSVDNLDQTINMIYRCICQTINVETNGFDIIGLLEKIDKYNNDIGLMGIHRTRKNIKVMYSPKTFTEDDVIEQIDKIKKVIDHPSVYLKIVADTTPLTEEFIKVVSRLTVNKDKIYLMPLGVTIDEIAKNWAYCIDLADECDLNLSTRMHIMNQFV